MSTPARQYRSPRREREALRTRQDILAAAKTLFLSEGYSHVTVADIAAAAGVALKTVYVSAGSKSEILHVLLTADVENSAAPQTLKAVRAASNLEEAIRAISRGTRNNTEEFADTIELLLASRSADSAAASTWEHILGEYRTALHDAAKQLLQAQHVSADAGLESLADLLWFYFGLGSWRALTIECQWTYDRAETWLARRATEAVRQEWPVRE
ncbi:MAG TPA: TetR family transcriptional regulator [Candidatus Agrococcus pullicola]|uniref:TetR family transcriptional regulator n=1 Tax=Candidatus Agrococcus pullicola TaxID=2838429 RepID=A0A9D1YWS3_9MICO|nr:TetR family transcriptional regulator [Candidatus Agrococcus pullicola]